MRSSVILAVAAALLLAQLPEERQEPVLGSDRPGEDEQVCWQ
jgi:hypothetical protein